jgi:hypothetical protein
MKKLLIGLLILISFSCVAQENINKVTGYDTTQTNLIIDSLEQEIITWKDSAISLKHYYDSVFLASPVIIHNDTLIIYKDTFDVTVISPSIKYHIEKSSYTVFQIQDSIKIQLDYRHNDVDFWIQDGTFTRYSSHIDLRR